MDKNYKGKTKVILIIGPSGAGKTFLCRALSEEFDYKHIDLDIEADVHGDKFYPERGKEIITSLEKKRDGKVYLVDIGAGFQNRNDFFCFFEKRKERLICIYESPKIVYQRKKSRDSDHEWRDLKEYSDCEYSEYRKILYSLGTKIINSDIQRTVKKIKGAIEIVVF